MYPILRLSYEMWLARKATKLELDETHHSRHRCWPWDVDFQFEMNNGRVLTLYDLGRIPAAYRAGLLKVMRANRWGFAMAGACVRYRRRITTFESFDQTTKVVGRDARFIYIVQTMWKRDGEAASNILYRSAIVGKSGIVPTDEVAAALGRPDWYPELPEWVQNWIKAEDTRPWPPEF